MGTQELDSAAAATGTAGQVASLRVLVAIITEFSPPSATQIGLPWDYHEKCRTSFEVGGLGPMFCRTLDFTQFALLGMKAEVTVVTTKGEKEAGDSCIYLKCFVRTYLWTVEDFIMNGCASADDSPMAVGIQQMAVG